MAIANVELTDTYNAWRTRTNLLITAHNDLTSTTGLNNLWANSLTLDVKLDSAKAFANTVIVRASATYSGTVDASNTTSINLGSIGNLTITGGSSGDALITDGAGGISFGVPTVNFNQLSGTIGNAQYPALHSPNVRTWTQTANTIFSATVNLGTVSDVRVSGGIAGEFLKSLGSGVVDFANVQFSDLDGKISNAQYPATTAPSVGTWTQSANTTFTANCIANNAYTSTGVRLRGTLVGLVEDQKTSGTHGGSFLNGADRTRDLNTIVYNPYSKVSIPAGNTSFQLVGPETYLIKWSAPAFRSNRHQTFLYDVTNATEIKRGTSEYAENIAHDENEPVFVETRSFGFAAVTITSNTEYEIRHRCSRTETVDGFGEAASFGTEVYTQVEIYLG